MFTSHSPVNNQSSVQLHSLINLTAKKTDEENANETNRLLKLISEKDISFQQVQKLVDELTTLILSNYFNNTNNENIILVPILRSGLAMWTAANRYFSAPESSFLICHKDKGTSNVYIMWPSKPTLKNKEVIILDTVIATGDTVNALCNYINKLNPAHDFTVTVLSCYASPEAIAVLQKNKAINKLIVGAVSETVDKFGYLIPATNGDMGDKLFGKKNVDYMSEVNSTNHQQSYALQANPTSANPRLFKTALYHLTKNRAEEAEVTNVAASPQSSQTIMPRSKL